MNRTATTCSRSPFHHLSTEVFTVSHSAWGPRSRQTYCPIRGRPIYKQGVIMCSNFRKTISDYLDNVIACCNKVMVVNPYTSHHEPPNERLMRGIEEADNDSSIPEQAVDDFRRQIAAHVGHNLWQGREGSCLPGLQKMVRAWLAQTLDLPLADPIWLTWDNGVVVRIAREIIATKRWSDCPVLADALEEAGCPHDRILAHLRDDAVKTDCNWCCCVNVLCLGHTQILHVRSS